MPTRPTASRSRALLGATLFGGVLLATPAPVAPDLLKGLVWRNLGPFRAGRVASVTGAIGAPGVFYAGMPAAGVWKTTNAGITWEPVFDDVKEVSAVGAIEVAPSDASIIYAGTGDIITGGGIAEGNGVYKSEDAGRTWRHLGLAATKQIPSILVDPRDPNLVLVAGQGDARRKSDARGVFRSTDGGRTWSKTLYINDSTGVEKLARAFDRPGVIFATTVRHYRPAIAPQGGGGGGFGGGAGATGPTGTALYKSEDEGLTWKEVTGTGLPRLNGRTSVAVAMHTDAMRVFLIGNFGLYRSDDGGASWRRMAENDSRIMNGQGGYNCGVYVNTANPDVVYTISTSSYVSRDGGNTFTGWKGAPGGDDPQQLWLDPTNPDRMLLGMDQGATVTLDGGRSWSTWYNQSTDQVYHLSVDNSFPAWVYAPQQDAGAIRTRMRGNFGAITPMDWNPVGGWEWGTIVADPLNPNMVYASGSGILRISYPSEQIINVSPQVDPDLRLRATSSNPIMFAPWNPKELLAGFQYLMATTDGGAHWTKLSPDLGYPKGVTPPPDTAARAPGTPPSGLIETFSPSTVSKGLIWVGTNNGLVKLTRDEGKSWEDVTIPGLPEPTRAFISMIDASHHDPAEAYVAISYMGIADYTPWLFRTKDYGKSWTKIINGLPTDGPAGSFTRVIRADPKKAGLLYAGTESSMYVSLDDGENWQSLGLNLPNTSYRDIAFKDNDVLVATYGRGLWVLDDASPLRQLTPAIASEAAHLFAPGEAWRVRRNVNQDTPFPPEVPHALNPPDGALIYYSLAAAPRGEITLDIVDAGGLTVRHFSSAPILPVEEAARPPHPNFWLEVAKPLPLTPGLNRVNWNLRYDDPPAFSHSFEINANPGLTPPSPEGLLAPPGTYTVRLTVDGHTFSQPLVVRNDPRSPASLADVRAQYLLASRVNGAIHSSWAGYQVANALRTAATKLETDGSSAEVKSAAGNFLARLAEVAGSTTGRGRFGGGFGGGGGVTPVTFTRSNGRLVGLLNTLEPGDLAPTAAMQAAWTSACRELQGVFARWQAFTAKELPALNAVLGKGGLAPLAAPATLTPPEC